MGILVDGPVTAATAPVDTAITAVLAGMSRRQLYEILSQARHPRLRAASPSSDPSPKAWNSNKKRAERATMFANPACCDACGWQHSFSVLANT